MSETRLSWETSTQGDTTVVHCSGELLAGVTDALYEDVKRFIPQNRRIVLDLTDLSRMDSMGLATVIRLYVSAKASGCALELINLNKRVRELLGLTNLLSVFEICGEQRIKM